MSVFPGFNNTKKLRYVGGFIVYLIFYRLFNEALNFVIWKIIYRGVYKITLVIYVSVFIKARRETTLHSQVFGESILKKKS